MTFELLKKLAGGDCFTQSFRKVLDAAERFMHKEPRPTAKQAIIGAIVYCGPLHMINEIMYALSACYGDRLDSTDPELIKELKRMFPECSEHPDE